MFTPVPPKDERPAEPVHPQAPDLRSLGRALPQPRLSRRSRIVKFALLGGGGTALLFGGALGIIAWIIMPPEVVPFPSTDRFTFLSSEQRIFIWPFALSLLMAPFMIVVFALAASAQVIAASVTQAANRKAEPREREHERDHHDALSEEPHD